MMSLNDFQSIFLYEFKLNPSAAETARKINQATYIFRFHFLIFKKIKLKYLVNLFISKIQRLQLSTRNTT